MLPPLLYWKNDRLYILDQRALPGGVLYLECSSAEDVAAAIETLAVRGAPAIGIAAAYGVVLASRGGRKSALAASMRLGRTRPTAVNLFWALRRMEEKMGSFLDRTLYKDLMKEANAIYADDLACNMAMGRPSG